MSAGDHDASRPGGRPREIVRAAAYGGLEKWCSKCDDWWPATRDFFHGDPGGVHRLSYCCKACYQAMYRPASGRRDLAQTGWSTPAAMADLSAVLSTWCAS